MTLSSVVKLFSVLLLSTVIVSFTLPKKSKTINIAPVAKKEIPEAITVAKEYTPLRQCQNSKLQKALEQTLNANPTWKKLIQMKKLSVGLVDLRDFSNAKYAAVNGKEMMYAASLPKIAILLAAMDAIDKGELKDTKEVRNDMHLMIAKSNNQASTRMIDRVGYKKISDVLMSPEYALYDRTHGGGLWVGKRYAAGGARNPEPMKGLSHAATAEQVCRYYYKLANGALVNEKRSKEMMDILVNPKLHHKFVNTLDKIAPNAKVYRKSGSWSNYHSDSAMVIGDASRKYIMVALTEDPAGEQIIRQLVYAVEKAMKISKKPKLATK
ncbi:MAG: serine hydrolase [Saprospiraceae bacterium]